MSIDAIRWAWMQQGLRPSQKLALLSLADRANEQHVCWPSIPRLAQDTGLDERTIYRAIKSLAALGLLRVISVPGAGNTYHLADLAPPPAQCRPIPDTASPLPLTPCQKPAPHHIEELKEEPTENRAARGRSRARNPKPKPAKAAFGTFGRVRLTADEHARLIAEHGERGEKAVAKLDAWLEAHGDKYKSHYGAMYAWVLRAVDEDEARTANARTPPGRPTLAERNMAVGAAWAERKRQEMMRYGSTGY